MVVLVVVVLVLVVLVLVSPPPGAKNARPPSAQPLDAEIEAIGCFPKICPIGAFQWPDSVRSIVRAKIL